MKKNIFITGSAGFIGYHLARRLAKNGYHVKGYDNFNDYYDTELKRDRANRLLQEVGVTTVRGDICDSIFLREQVDLHQTTHFVHLAAQAGVRYSLTHPQTYIKNNIEGFVNVLEVCKSSSLSLIYASSSSVYGHNKKTPFSITDRTDQQASLYGVTKKTNELMAETYHRLYGFPVTGLRFFTVYGPWGRPDMAYFKFTKAILAEKSIDVFHDGILERDFTYIDDIVDGTIAAIHLDSSHCELFNLGNNRPSKVLDLIGALEVALGKKANLNLMPMQPGDVFTTYADIDSSHQRLKFAPKVDLQNGISHFVAWYHDYHK